MLLNESIERYGWWATVTVHSVSYRFSHSHGLIKVLASQSLCYPLLRHFNNMDRGLCRQVVDDGKSLCCDSIVRNSIVLQLTIIVNSKVARELKVGNGPVISSLFQSTPNWRCMSHLSCCRMTAQMGIFAFKIFFRRMEFEPASQNLMIVGLQCEAPKIRNIRLQLLGP